MNDENKKSLEEELQALIQASNEDNDYNAKKALVSSIPAVGSLVAHFYETYIKNPVTQRHHNFLKILVQELIILKEQANEVNLDNPVFQTAFMQAANIAVRNHQQEKLKALKNAVLNSSMPNSPEDDLQIMFLHWIDEFTTRHLVVLRLLYEESSYEEFQSSLPDLDKKLSFYDQILKDLENKGLVYLHENHVVREIDKSPIDYMYDNLNLSTPDLVGQVTPFGRATVRERNKRTKTIVQNFKQDICYILENLKKQYIISELKTDLGQQFLNFIKSPLNDDASQ